MTLTSILLLNVYFFETKITRKHSLKLHVNKAVKPRKLKQNTQTHRHTIHALPHICMYVCVCGVCRERDKKRGGERQRQRDGRERMLWQFVISVYQFLY